jgi:hypothetical protein
MPKTPDISHLARPSPLCVLSAPCLREGRAIVRRLGRSVRLACFGTDALMPVDTAPCFQFAKSGACTYGERCRFSHGDGGSASSDALPDASPAAAASVPVATRAAQSVRVVLFVAGLPACVPGPRVRRALRTAFAPFRPGALRLGMTHAALTRGWGHVTMPSRDAAEAAVAALDGLAITVDADTCATLRVALVTGKQDSLFPWATRAQRLQLRLDAVALQCCADAAFGERSAALIAAFMRLATRPLASGADSDDAEVTWRVTDGCACAGGSAIAFARCASVASVTAIELEASRASDLAHNAAVLGLEHRVNALCGDYVAMAPQLSGTDVLFLDPPWGGSGYSKAPIAWDALRLSDVPIGQLAAEAAGRGAAAVALATPRNFDDEGLARDATRRKAGATRHADRPLPFRADFGARMLVLLLYPPCGEARPVQRFAFPTALLDGAPSFLHSYCLWLWLMALTLRCFRAPQGWWLPPWLGTQHTGQSTTRVSSIGRRMAGCRCRAGTARGLSRQTRARRLRETQTQERDSGVVFR